MIIKFSKFERIAGLFVLAALVGAIVSTVGVAVKKGWFSSKVEFTTHFESADGVFPGTSVQVAGLRAGQVTEVELMSAEEVQVKISIFEKFHKRIRKDSRIQMIRPFVIGDKVLEITIGSENEPMIKKGGEIPAETSFDMMDLVSGKKLSPFLGTMEALMTNLSTLAKAFADPKRTEAFVKMFDRMEPLFLSLEKMSREVSFLARNVNKWLPQVKKNNPEMGKDLGEMIANLNTITKNLAPAMKKAGPELPDASLRALEALDEVVVLLKAMQKTWLLSGKVKDVRENEKKKRKPSSEDE